MEQVIALLAALGFGALLNEVVRAAIKALSGEGKAAAAKVTAETRAVEVSFTERLIGMAERALDRAEEDVRDCMEKWGFERSCRERVEAELAEMRRRFRDELP